MLITQKIFQTFATPETDRPAQLFFTRNLAATVPPCALLQQMSRVLIGGGTGLVGQALKTHLTAKGCTVTLISRTPGSGRITWDQVEQMAKTGTFQGYDAVINLAGTNLLNFLRRWTPAYQEEVRASRLGTNRLLAQAIDAAPPAARPKVFVHASGAGYYPAHPTKVYTEDWIQDSASKAGTGGSSSSNNSNSNNSRRSRRSIISPPRRGSRSRRS
eukprot:m.151100 g.151100  ORF g.151100 m.151100 type:complete len:216 (-) comp16894_c4_seq18:2798-3445(-)